jgi:hypothetical protein
MYQIINPTPSFDTIIAYATFEKKRKCDSKLNGVFRE